MGYFDNKELNQVKCDISTHIVRVMNKGLISATEALELISKSEAIMYSEELSDEVKQKELEELHIFVTSKYHL